MHPLFKSTQLDEIVSARMACGDVFFAAGRMGLAAGEEMCSLLCYLCILDQHMDYYIYICLSSLCSDFLVRFQITWHGVQELTSQCKKKHREFLTFH